MLKEICPHADNAPIEAIDWTHPSEALITINQITALTLARNLQPCITGEQDKAL